jgi:hypothetical protein
MTPYDYYLVGDDISCRNLKPNHSAKRIIVSINEAQHIHSLRINFVASSWAKRMTLGFWNPFNLSLKLHVLQTCRYAVIILIPRGSST